MNDAQERLHWGTVYPYDDTGPSKDWAHAAARGVLADLGDRGGIKHELRKVEPEIRAEIVESIGNIIRRAGDIHLAMMKAGSTR